MFPKKIRRLNRRSRACESNSQEQVLWSVVRVILALLFLNDLNESSVKMKDLVSAGILLHRDREWLPFLLIAELSEE